MKTLKILFLLPLSILSLKTTAQIDDLLKNKDITWAVEVYNDFLTEAAHGDKIGKEISRVTQLKLLNEKEKAMDETFVFQNILMNNVKEGKVPIYKDSLCKIVMLPKDLLETDTLPGGDPITFEQKIKVVSFYPAIEYILFFRARQVFFFDEKKAQFGLRTLAVAPMKRVFTETGEPTGWKPLFWMKATDLTQKGKLTDNAITWAAQMNLFEGMAINADSSNKILKQTGVDAPFASLFKTLLNNPKIPFYKFDSFDAKEKLNMLEREGCLFSRDTMIDPESVKNGQELKVKIVVLETKINAFQRLKLIQNWYWNDKRQRLEIYLLATAPLKDLRNEVGEFLYRKPLFYRRTDD
jgi:hypothetical protein